MVCICGMGVSGINSQHLRHCMSMIIVDSSRILFAQMVRPGRLVVVTATMKLWNKDHLFS